MSLFAVLFVIFVECIYLRLRSASRYKFIGKECIYEQFSLFVSCGKCTHAHDICIVAESCSLSRIYIRYQSCISTRYFICCDRYTDSGSADQDSSVIFFSCYCLAYCDCNVSVDRIFTSEILCLSISFFCDICDYFLFCSLCIRITSNSDFHFIFLQFLLISFTETRIFSLPCGSGR